MTGNVTIEVTQEALDDITRFSATYPSAMAEIAALLQELESSPDLADLLKDGHVDDRIDVNQVRSLQERNLDVWRLKSGPKDMPTLSALSFDPQKQMKANLAWKDFRILYAYHALLDRIYVLVVAKRSGQTYEPSSHEIQRAKKAVARLGIAAIPPKDRRS